MVEAFSVFGALIGADGVQSEAFIESLWVRNGFRYCDRNRAKIIDINGMLEGLEVTGYAVEWLRCGETLAHMLIIGQVLRAGGLIASDRK